MQIKLRPWHIVYDTTADWYQFLQHDNQGKDVQQLIAKVLTGSLFSGLEIAK